MVSSEQAPGRHRWFMKQGEHGVELWGYQREGSVEAQELLDIGFQLMEHGPVDH